MWSRFTTRSIRAINALHRSALIISRHSPGVLRRAAPYLIGVPLMLAIPASGFFAGLRLSRDPKFAGAKVPWLDQIIAAGFFLAGAFFAAERRFGLLPAIAIAAFVTLAIFLLIAKVVGILVLTAFRRESFTEPVGDQTSAHVPQFAELLEESEPAPIG